MNKASESTQRGSSGVDCPGRPGVSMIRKVSWTVGNWGLGRANEVGSVPSGHEYVEAPFVALLGRLPLIVIVLRYSFLALKTRVDGQGLPELRATWGKWALHERHQATGRHCVEDASFPELLC